MEKSNMEVYTMFKTEYVTIVIPRSIKCLVISELKKYIMVLQTEFKMTGEMCVLEDIEDSKTLFLRLALTTIKENEKVEVTISEFLLLMSMLYCSLSALERFGKVSNTKMDEYRKLYESLDVIRKMLGESRIDEYIKFQRHYKQANTNRMQ
ncbi:hypothetical protein [Pseudobacteroides cellulosolvens]|uniref:Uncharacterized protein n=1 Tax=Pseudobacteroides cellulosolvens ATCC 35603 = DSM 2933 TaxID=398512 RepID=A0A0L6JJ81_9FIRM|nr:hypothetical protein [Pseudobacteroides cellulosolvens]KNY25497.1 hypothetical protein Bccel_0757 [Pseudobacteroides cellulosolvens ATCC 35603 = DSM 2933]